MEIVRVRNAARKWKKVEVPGQTRVVAMKKGTVVPHPENSQAAAYPSQLASLFDGTTSLHRNWPSTTRRLPPRTDAPFRKEATNNPPRTTDSSGTLPGSIAGDFRSFSELGYWMLAEEQPQGTGPKAALPRARQTLHVVPFLKELPNILFVFGRKRKQNFVKFIVKPKSFSMSNLRRPFRVLPRIG